jgi:hypothetical protein
MRKDAAVELVAAFPVLKELKPLLPGHARSPVDQWIDRWASRLSIKTHDVRPEDWANAAQSQSIPATAWLDWSTLVAEARQCFELDSKEAAGTPLGRRADVSARVEAAMRAPNFDVPRHRNGKVNILKLAEKLDCSRQVAREVFKKIHGKLSE